MQKLLKKLSGAQLARSALLQSNAVNVAPLACAAVGEHDKTTQWHDAVKAVQTAVTQP